MPKYSNDPRWLLARYAGECSKCKAAVARGDSVYYYPNGRKILCSRDECGGQASRDFDAAAQDDAFMTGGMG